MFYAGIDMLFSILFPILFLVVLGMILYTIIGNISTWNKNNHSPRLTVPATVVAKRTEVSRTQEAKTVQQVEDFHLHMETSVSQVVVVQLH